jgi:hypothetical protein
MAYLHTITIAAAEPRHVSINAIERLMTPPAGRPAERRNLSREFSPYMTIDGLPRLGEETISRREAVLATTDDTRPRIDFYRLNFRPDWPLWKNRIPA